MRVSLLNNISKLARSKLLQNAPVVLREAGLRQNSDQAEEDPSYPYRIERTKGSEDFQFLKFAIQQTFFYDEPSTKLFKLNGTENCGELIPLMLESIDCAESFMARRNCNDEVVGFALNGEFDQCKLDEDLKRQLEIVKEPRNRKLLCLWNAMTKEFDYNLVIPQGKAMNIFYVGVVPNARGEGLAKKLIEYSLSCAKFREYDIAQAYCTSDDTAKICKSLGMTVACTVDYDKLLMPDDGRPIVTEPPPAPDNRIKVYYKLLKC